MVVKRRSRSPCDARRDLPRTAARGRRGTARRPSVHSAPCRRRRRRRRRAEPTTRRAARPRTRSTGPGSTRASCSSFVATPRRRRARPARASGRSALGRPRPRRRRHRARAGRVRRARRPAPVAAPAARSSPTPSDVVDYAVAERVGAGASRRASSPCRASAGDATDRSVRASCSSRDRVLTARAPARRAPTAVAVVTTDRRRARRPRSWAPTRDRPRAARGRRAATSSSRRSAVERAARSARPVVAVGATQRRTGHASASTWCRDRDVMVDAGTGIDVAGLLETGIADRRRDGGRRAARHRRQRRRHPHRRRRGRPRRARVPVDVARDVADQLERRAARSPTAGSACCATPTTPTGPAAARRSSAVVPGSPAGDGRARSAGDV